MKAPVVLHVTTSAISLELLLGKQLQALAAAGYRVVTCSAPGPEVATLRRWGIEHHPLRHSTRAFSPGDDLRAAVELFRVIRLVRPDLVHTHNPKTGVYGRIIARTAGVPAVVNTVHGLYAQPTDPWRRRWAVYSLERLAAAFSHAELVVSPEDVAVLRGLKVPAARLTRLHSGVDLKRFAPTEAAAAAGRSLRASLGITDREIVVCVVGRLVREKGYAEVFAAGELLRARGVQVRWLVAGPRDETKSDAVGEASLAAAAAAGVLFLGQRDDMPTVYAAADLFVLASYREGLPQAAMEAAAMGLPVVATDVRGCRQVVDNGRSGLLVPARDADALATAVTTLTESPERRSVMGAAARVKAEREFDEETAIQQVLTRYDALLGRGEG